MTGSSPGGRLGSAGSGGGGGAARETGGHGPCASEGDDAEAAPAAPSTSASILRRSSPGLESSLIGLSVAILALEQTRFLFRPRACYRPMGRFARWRTLIDAN